MKLTYLDEEKWIEAGKPAYRGTLVNADGTRQYAVALDDPSIRWHYSVYRGADAGGAWLLHTTDEEQAVAEAKKYRGIVVRGPVWRDYQDDAA